MLHNYLNILLENIRKKTFSIKIFYFILASCSRDFNDRNFTYYDLFNLLQGNGPLNPQSKQSREFLFKKLCEKYDGKNWMIEYTNTIKASLNNFTIVLSRKWIQCNRNIHIFSKNNSVWLQTIFNLPMNNNNILTNVEKNQTGRPSKEFLECSERTKRQKVLPLVKSYSSPELVLALSTKFQKSGKRSASLLLNDSLASPKRATKMRNIINNVVHNNIIAYTANEALAFLIENKLTKQQYLNIRLGAKKKNCDIYPPYASILEAKKKMLSR